MPEKIDWTEEVAFYDDSPRTVWAKILACGLPGCGKTHFLGTWPDPLVLDTDNGGATLRKLHIPFISMDPGWQTSRIMMDILISLKQGRGIKLPDRKEPYKPKTLGIDTLTALSDLMEMELTKYPREESKDPNKEVMSLADYRVHRRRMLSLARTLQQMPMHVIVTANVEMVEDQISGRTRMFPSVAGKKLPNEMAELFDEVYYLEYDKQKGKHMLHSKPFDNFEIGKSRYGVPEFLTDPHFEDLEDFFKPAKKEVRRTSVGRSK